MGASVLLAAFALAVSCFAPAPRAARADGVTYSDNKRTFKVGILLLDSTIVTDPNQAGRGPENPDPYLFYIADARTDVKPVNWELINPLAPRTVTTAIYNRWSQNGADPNRGRDPGHPYQVGQKVEKSMAAYWEVSLNDTSEADLLQYDLLFITNHRDVGLSPVEKEKLRKLVDAGGIVWLEDCGNMRIRGNSPFFLENLQFRNEGGQGNAGPYIFRPDHPLLTNPYKLSFQEISNLGDKNYANYYMSGMVGADYVAEGVEVPRGTSGRGIPPEPQTLVNIVGNRATATNANGSDAMPYIAAGNYGSGAVIATSSDSGCDINDYAGGTNVGSGGNSGAYCGPNIRTAHAEDLKFLYNAVAWGSANNTERRNGRRTASSFESVGAPLVPNFAFSNGNTPDAAIVRSSSSPIIVKGVMYVSGVNTQTGKSTVRAYDIQPGSDLDGDGNPDDGKPDLALGYSYDEIWEWNDSGGPAATLNTQPSSPVFANVFNGTATVDRIFVTLPSGAVVNMAAMPRDANERLLADNTDFVSNNVALVGSPATYASANRGVAPAPTLFGNRIYVIQPDGLVRCVDEATMTTLWTTFDQAPNPQIRPASSPTLGFVRLATKNTGATFADNSSGSTNDLMLYVPTVITDTAGAVQSGKVKTYFLGTRNEVQTGISGQGIISTRVAGASKDQYFIAPARPVGTYNPFQNPVARVYADIKDANGVVIKTREQNYAEGRVSTEWTATFLVGTVGGLPDGRVQVSRISDGTFPQGSDRVMIAADYDVLYITNGNKPPQITADGARENAQLNIPQLPQINFGLDTVPLSTDDLLLYGVNQLTPNNATGLGFSPVIYGVNDQEFQGGGTRTRWRFVIHDGYSNVAVNGQPVSDLPVLRNRLRFDPNWPAQDSAVSANVDPGSGYPLAEPITNARIIGAPIVGNNGVTYVLAAAKSRFNSLNPNNSGGDVSVLMAFKTNPEITLVLPDGDTFEPGTLNVSQLDALSFDPTQGTGDTVSTQVNAVQFTTGSSRDRVTISSFQGAGGGQAFSASQTFVLKYTPTGTSSNKTVIVPPVAEAPDGSFGTNFNPNSDTTVRNAASQVSPLLWYYVLPYAPLSSPTLIGDSIYFTQNRTVSVNNTLVQASGIVAVDADPASTDGTVRPAEQIRNVAAAIDGVAVDSHVRWINQNLIGKNAPAFSAAPPVGGQGVLALNSDQGTFSFQEGLTLIAEANRVIEVDASGAATWSLDTTLFDSVIGGQLPVYNFGGGTVADPDPDLYRGRQAVVRKALARPAVARKLGNADYLIADTGNNRIVRVDRSGRLLWNLDKIADPYGVLASGDSFTLQDPTDVYFYLTRSYDTGGTPNGYEAHYLIADAGNFRIVEVADFYDNNGAIRNITDTSGASVTGEHVAVWTTRTTTNEGRNLRFQNLRGFVGADTGGTLFGFPYLIAIVGNASTPGDGAQQGDSAGGSVVVMNYQPFNSKFVIRNADGSFNRLEQPWPAPAVATDPARKSEPVGNGVVTQSVNDIIINTGLGDTVKRITRPTFLDTITLGGVRQYILCDADGVFAVAPETITVNGAPRVRFRATWIFQQSDYNTMNGIVSDGGVNDGNPIAGGRLAYPTGLTPAQAFAGAPRFSPTSVKRLTNGNYLITNNGANDSPFFEGRRFVGEVFEIAPNTATGTTTAKGGAFAGFSAPKLIGKGIGTGATNVQQMGVKNNTSLMEQPTSADRL